MDTEVLVVGAGPTGLMLANQLGRRGVRPIIIDRHAGPSLQTRALGVQARTLEIYSHLGIVERALELGKRATGANIWVQGRRAARVPLGDIGRDLSPYPFLLILGQDDNERLLGEALRNRGMPVHNEAMRIHPERRPPDGLELSRRLAGCALLEPWSEADAHLWWETHLPRSERPSVDLAIEPAPAAWPS